ncbi:MAG: ATP-binding cassette domain-containing protein [Treponema sp.]|jgi:ATP-binding cassette subfamily F protein 3|nr:ATP-binding cassette domain-containing protein [Treponema sp.]
MAFVQFSKVSLSFGDRDILKDVSLRLAGGSRSCLTGANGSGKSTLMKIIAGKMNCDSGERAVQKDTRVSYLPQSGIVHHGRTLRDETETAFSFVHVLLEKLEKIGELLEKEKSSTTSTQALIEEHHSLQERIEESGYYRREGEIASVLSGLGFSEKDIDRDTGEFSGGWQMRIALAKVLLEKPDILLLDEPTNYLDIEARNWLEEWLKKFSGGYLLVSHDRYFLDVSVNEVYELFGGNLKRYAGNYSAYEKTRKTELATLVKRYDEQQEEIVKNEALIRRFRYKASKAAFAQELIKRLEKMERIEIPESFKKINISFPPPPHSPNIALTLEGIGKSYGKKCVLSALDLCLDAKERLVVAGPNGAGKSTLLRIISGADSDYEGSVKMGTGIKAGYFSQDAAEALNSQKTILEFMEEDSPTALIPKLRDMLGAFLFRGDDVYKSVSVLSGGEKSRLALLKMFLKPMNLLILDEPTNHLDLYSKDILLDALKKFSGTIIFVSHDRMFMEELSTKTLELTPGDDLSPATAKLFYGDYAYYLSREQGREEFNHTPKYAPRQAVLMNEATRRGAQQKLTRQTVREDFSPSSAPDTENTEDQKQHLSMSSEERRRADKQRQAVVRRMERKEAEILNVLEELENKKAALETELARPDVYSSGEKAREVKQKLDECVNELEIKTKEWEAIVEEMGASS